jgi:RNA polymerase sigma-70 factor, ECF subfamily
MGEKENRYTQFTEAFEKHSDELFRHASLRLPDRERALEITQETFLRVWQYVEKGGVINTYRPFLYRTLNNMIVDEYRKHKTQSLDALLESEEAGAAIEGTLLRSESNELEEAMIRFESEQAIVALQKLPEPYRIVLILRYIDGFSLDEIAESLDERENNISVRIHRGLRKLREMLAHEEK